jgi:L-aspartate oxidase
MEQIKEQYDVLIVGTGAAGLFAALQFPQDKQILMITKDAIENSDSYLAQGGICMLKSPDDFESYYEDTMRAGRYENNPDSVRIMIEQSPAIIRELLEYGVDFERDENGELLFTREGAHSTFRILYHQDVTGKEITSRLIDRIRERKNIHVFEHTTMLDWMIEENEAGSKYGKRCEGIILRCPDQTVKAVRGRVTILATGGLGGLFRHSTNFRHITGDSFALALEHGVEIQDINYIQIHPTTLYSTKGGRSFLISESVRGEGAILLNPNGKRFVDELLPRDVVATAIREEMEKFNSPYVYLSLEHMPKEEIIHRFPNIYERCLEEGYDLSKEPIPITPAQHYFMGGVKADTQAQTSCERLYAVGETGCNGVHGANRLASNSLLESLVFAKRAVEKIETEFDAIKVSEPKVDLGMYQDDKALQKKYKQLVMNEIKRKDEDFYVKWCNDEN